MIRFFVIFDMDGVIVDTERVYRSGHLHAAKLLGLPEEMMREASERVAGVTAELERQIMEKIFASFPQYDYEEAFHICREYFNNAVEAGEIELKPGAEQILRTLKDKGVPVGLASSSSRELIEKVLERHDVLRYFDVAVSGDMVRRGKPDPEIFLLCAAKLGISREDYCKTFVIEDSYNGIRAAYAAGMRAVMVPDLLPPTEEMYAKATVLPSLAEVEKRLLELYSQ